MAKGDRLRKEIVENLRVVLTPEEKLDRMERLAKVGDEVEQMEGEKKDVMAEYATKLKAKAGHAKELREAIRVGEKRDVKCEQVFDFKENVVTITRLDTGEEISKRPLTNQDRQMHLIPEKPEKPKKGKGKGDASPFLPTTEQLAEGLKLVQSIHPGANKADAYWLDEVMGLKDIAAAAVILEDLVKAKKLVHAGTNKRPEGALVTAYAVAEA